MNRHSFHGISEKKLLEDIPLSVRQVIAKKLGIKISKDKVDIPEEVFRVFSPKALGKFLGGLLALTVGDLVYEALAKKVVEKYPNSKNSVRRVLFVVKHLDVLIRPSWFKFGVFAASNVKEFKKGFGSSGANAKKFNKYLWIAIKKRVGKQSSKPS